MVLCVLMERAFRIHLRPFEATGYFFFRLRKKKQESLVLADGFYCSGCQPGGILLSSEDFRQLAGGLFFFRRRKKNQESSVKSANVGVGLFTASCRRALLLSSLKEVSKKGATVSTRWTPTREQSPLDPALRNTYRVLPLPASTRPTLRAGGAGPTAAGK